jgi:hypothetical protein
MQQGVPREGFAGLRQAFENRVMRGFCVHGDRGANEKFDASMVSESAALGSGQ